MFPVVQAEGVVPRWLGTQSHIYHMNGTIEEEAGEHRSPFLLETDGVSQRVATQEANIAYNKLLWSKCAVVVGMSLECETDQTFLAAMSREEDNVPLGESRVYIVNPDKLALDAVCDRISSAEPPPQFFGTAGLYHSIAIGGVLRA